MESQNNGAKSLSAKTRGAVAEAISGLFSDMFSAEDKNSQYNPVEEEHGIGHTASKAAGQAVSTMAQTSQRMSMMRFMRQQGSSAGKGGKPVSTETAADFAATTGMDLDGDGSPDF